MSVFPNARKKASGIDTHFGTIETEAVPGLGGTLTVEFTDISDITPIESGTVAENTSAEKIIQTRDITFAGAINIGRIKFLQKSQFGLGSNTGSFTLRLREDDLVGNELTSINHPWSSGTIHNDVLQSELENIAVGVKTYVLTWESNISVIVTRTTYSTIGGVGASVEIDDTHAGTIASIAVAGLGGQNTMYARETSVLP